MEESIENSPLNAWKNIISKLEGWLIVMIAIFIPLEKRLIPSIIIIYAVLFVLNGKFLLIWNGLKNNKYVQITTAYYLFLVMAVSYSDNFASAIFDLEVKTALLVFPLLFSALKLNYKEVSNVLSGFVFGCLMAMLICLGIALFYFLDERNISVFFYHQLSIFHHTTYFSMYLDFAILIVYYYMIYDRKRFFIKSLFSMVGVIICCSLFVVLLSSKMGLIGLFLVIFVGTIMWFLKKRAIFPSIMVFVMLSTLIYISFKYSSVIQSRLQEAVVSLTDEKPRFSTTGARLLVWEIAVDKIIEKPLFGYGTGDVKDELMSMYKEKGYDFLYEHQLNAHNQYLQMLIAIGIFGSVLFWLYLFYPVRNALRQTNLLYIGLIGIISMNLLTESMFETQAGVVFFAFFNALLYFSSGVFPKIKFID